MSFSDEEDNNPFAGSGINGLDGFTDLSIDGPTSHNGAPSTQTASAVGLTGPSETLGSRRSEDINDYQPIDNVMSNGYSADYSSKVEHILLEDLNFEITITEAGKSHEGHSRGYIVYTIKCKDLIVKRRYSEFESLRTTLTRLFPTLIIPPIPEKHTMSDYAIAPTKAKEDATVIEHRRRMLAVFLNRCKSMEQLRHSSVFQRFLDPNSNWNEVLNTSPVIDIPKSILKVAPLDPAASTEAHSYLSIPPSTAKLKGEEDVTFSEAELNAKEYEIVISGGLEKVNRRLVRRFSDMTADLSELGGLYNTFSLEESASLASTIEHIGQAFDGEYISTESLVASLSSCFSEPLGESAQFAAVVRGVLKYRRQKALQQEMTLDLLESKKSSLDALERSEQEAQRIESILQRDLTQSQRISSETTRKFLDQNDDQDNADHEAQASSKSAPSSPLPVTTHRRKISGFKIPGIGKLNTALHGIMDNDPEATRRNKIGKTKEQISHLQSALDVVNTDVTDASESIKKDLERFQATKEEDLRNMVLGYASCLLEWARKNLETWEDAKRETLTI